MKSEDSDATLVLQIRNGMAEFYINGHGEALIILKHYPDLIEENLKKLYTVQKNFHTSQ